MSGRQSQLGLAGLGLELAAAVAGGVLVGFWIDRHFGSAPWGVVVGGLVGIVGGLTNFVRQARRAMGESFPPSDEDGRR